MYDIYCILYFHAPPARIVDVILTRLHNAVRTIVQCISLTVYDGLLLSPTHVFAISLSSHLAAKFILNFLTLYVLNFLEGT